VLELWRGPHLRKYNHFKGQIQEKRLEANKKYFDGHPSQKIDTVKI
jgi:hypothetical protein